MAHHAVRISLMLVLTAAASAAIPGAAAGATLHVAGNGLDGVACGPKQAPCRSISAAIARAADGDKIIVGPGRYGDLDLDGTLGEIGEETPAPGCGCMLAVNKAVSLTSSDGAVATVIDAQSVGSPTNVLLIMNGGEFGRPGKGFTVTNTSSSDGAGIVIDSIDVAVRGNQVIVLDAARAMRTGIATVDFPETILIDGNQVIGWRTGIRVRGAGKTVQRNQAAHNDIGIWASAGKIAGNVALRNEQGFVLDGSAQPVTHNAAYGNRLGFTVTVDFAGGFEKNNIFGNRVCGLQNDKVGLVASNNFWGAPSGPGADPADEVCDLGLATSTVTPVATKAFRVRLAIKP